MFTRAQALVERLLEAKRELRLTRELKRLDHCVCLALDDIGYVQQDRAEMEVLFTLLAERYERRSMMITVDPESRYPRWRTLCCPELQTHSQVLPV